MKKITHKHFGKMLAVLPLLILSSCIDFETDLDVENTENPDDRTINFDASALESTAAGLYQNFYLATTSTNGPGFALNTMADASTCSWGNFGMRDLSSEPRIAFNNTTSWAYASITSSPFNAYYSILADANTILVQVLESPEDFSEPALMESIARFTQALTIGYNALLFDRVWLSDETGSLNEGGYVGYQEAMEFALAKLDQGIAVANANSFTVPDSWFPGNSLSSADLAALMNSYGARMLVMNSRNSTDKASTDWNRVLTYANNGIGDFEILHDDTTWYDLLKTYLVYPGWAQIDMRVVNLMDPNTPDYWPTGAVLLPPATSADARLATDYEYLDSQTFRPERGEYHYSNYRYSRYDEYITVWTVTTPEFYKAETDMYAAEANLQLNNLAAAAGIINAGTRVSRGGLPPVAADADAIAAAIHYERMVEFPCLSMGLPFFEMRKENLLQGGTLLHFPVPASALEAIPAELYTYGGTSGVAGQDYSSGGWR